LPPFLGIREDLVGVLYLLETLLGLGVVAVGVRVMLARQFAVGAPYLLLRRTPGYPQNIVEILFLHTLSLSRNYNLCGAYRFTIEDVSPLEGLKDRTLLVVFRGLAHNGFMDVWVEELAV
jgi:hypothetical protein